MPSPPPDEVRQRRLEHLTVFLRESEKIHADWDIYSDEHTDVDGWPHDSEAYGLRAAVRDAATWRSFNRVRHCAGHLLATAEAQRQQLPPNAIQPHWAWQLGVLDDALKQLGDLQREWLHARAALPASAKPGTQAYDDALDERNREAWHHLNMWTTHGQAFLEIHAAAHASPSLPGATATKAPAAARLGLRLMRGVLRRARRTPHGRHR